jgi:YD repeat-containing protein
MRSLRHSLIPGWSLLTNSRHADTTWTPTWSYTFDRQGRQTSSVDPDKGTITTTYKPDGQVDTTTDALGITLTYEYVDNLGRKTALWQGTTTTGTKRASWTYDTVTGGKRPTRFGHPHRRR